MKKKVNFALVPKHGKPNNQHTLTIVLCACKMNANETMANDTAGYRNMRERILHFLKKHNGYLSGEEISHTLSISRAAIWKYMQDLRKEGYDIIAVPHLGYQLISSPDKLFEHEIQEELHTKIFGKRIFHYETTPSTMDVAFDLGLKGYPEGTVVCAEVQTKGRGRLKRGWSSPKGKGIYLSVILRPKVPPAEVSKFTLLCAVAVAEAVNTVAAVQAMIKWPNDVMINGKKLAGILTELNAEADRVKFVVVGIGVNVNARRDLLPYGATSLSSEVKTYVSRLELTKEMLRKIEIWYAVMQKKGFVPIADRWRQLSFTLHQCVRVVDSSGCTQGEAVDIDNDGGLLIREDTGVVTKKMAGDVTLVR